MTPSPLSRLVKKGGDDPAVTTEALGEEGGDDLVATTLALGEEGGMTLSLPLKRLVRKAVVPLL